MPIRMIVLAVTLTVSALAAAPAFAGHPSMVLFTEIAHETVEAGQTVGSNGEVFSSLTGEGLSGCAVDVSSTLTVNDSTKDKLGPGTISVRCAAGGSSNVDTLEGIELSSTSDASSFDHFQYRAKLKMSPLTLTVGEACPYVFKKLSVAFASSTLYGEGAMVLYGEALGKLNKKASKTGCAASESVSYNIPVATFHGEFAGEDLDYSFGT